MKTLNKWMKVVIVLIAGGLSLCLFSLAIVGFDFDNLATENYVTKNYDITKNFTKISVDVSTSDITLVPSDDGKCRVVCFEEEDYPHDVVTDGDTLTIKSTEKSIYENFNFEINSKHPSVKIYLPEKTLQDVLINGTTGDIEIKKLTCVTLDVHGTTGDLKLENIIVEGDISLENTTGDVELEHCDADSVSADITTGDILLSDVIASEKLRINVTTGFIQFYDCDAETIYAETSTGDIKGNLLSGKNFNVETNTGDIDVPQNSRGGICDLHTNTGDIRISVN